MVDRYRRLFFFTPCCYPSLHKHYGALPTLPDTTRHNPTLAATALCEPFYPCLLLGLKLSMYSVLVCPLCMCIIYIYRCKLMHI
ncbi:hypothetical protein BC832DRAFT_84439 [Gaertneriomyces semiglobifer]|nr:hypothetical protein BC832DRAFT_84439 [Gaertneriomyces semiglobifer]